MPLRTAIETMLLLMRDLAAALEPIADHGVLGIEHDALVAWFRPKRAFARLQPGAI